MKALLPYVLVGLFVGGMVWAVAVGRLPPADFTFTNGDEIKTVDPALVTGQPEGRIIWALFEGLCRWHPETLEPLPGMAESWEVSADKRTYTFSIRPEALWSDGTAVTAEDFAWSWRRFLHPGTASEYAKELWYIEGAKKFTTRDLAPGDPVEIELHERAPGVPPFAEGKIVRGRLVAIDQEEGEDVYRVEIDGRARRFRMSESPGGEDVCRWVLYDFRHVGIRVPDERTLEVRLRHPVPYFVGLMGFYPMFPVNRRCVETYGFPAWTKPENIVNNGAFRLKFRRIRDRIRLVRSETYWNRENVHLRTVDALAVKSNTTVLNLYMTGQADWITAVPTEVVPELLARPQGDFHPAPLLSNYYYLVNTTRPPLDDSRVRRALSLAMDRREIVEKLTRGGQAPAMSFVPDALSDYVDYAPAHCGEYDPDEARRLLAEAGFPGGRGCPKVEILYNAMESHRAIAELIMSQWKRTLGIDVGLVQQEWTAYLSARRRKEYQVARAGWIGDYVDPNTFLDLFVSDNPQNQSGWSNPEYDRLIEAAQHEADDQRRMELFRRAEGLLLAEMPAIPIYFSVSQSMVRPYVRGLYPNIQDVHPLWAIRIDEAEKDRVLREEGLR
jgi:oligopeptide transport system substrate-binding protein